MASGFSSNSGDFFGSTSFNGGSVNGGSGLMNSVQLHQLQHDHISSLPLIPNRRSNDFVSKRSISELEKQQLQGGFLRSVKQRNHQFNYNHTSPISPLTPFDFSSMGFVQGGNQSHGVLQNLRSLLPTTNPSFSNREFETEKKMRNRLQELEKQLFDDNDEDESDVVSVVTSSEWSETMQNLITPNQNQKPFFSPSPTSSSCSSSSSSSSQSLICSSKQSLIDVATAISEGNIDVATSTIDRLKRISNPLGDPEQRLTAYMVSALQSRINSTQNHLSLCTKDHLIATQMLYEASPCFKLGFMAANLAILETIKDQPNNNVHVVDFNIGQGNQYFSLMHALSDRKLGIPINIKITSVLDSSMGNEHDQRIVGDSLRKLADRVGIGFKFNIVCRNNINELNHESLYCDSNEALVVNFAFRLYKMPDESVSTENPRDELLRRVKSLNPRVVTLVEQEMNGNTAPFVARVAEVSSYYFALFNSLDLTMNRDGSERVRIEECLARKAVNSVACEGRERVERCEVFGKWRARMGMAGFVARPLSKHVAESMKAKLSPAYRNNPGFTVKEEAGGICFGWMDRVLTVASAWR